MSYYPAFLHLEGRACLLIGGGSVAQQKVKPLLDAGALVTLISPRLTADLQALADAGRITHERRPYRRGDLDGFFLVIAATDDEAVHAAIAAEAGDLGILLNVVDRPAFCNFIVPAIVRRGDLAIAISTGGRSPILASRIRRQLEGEFGPEYATALRVLGSIRSRLADLNIGSDERKQILTAIVDGDVVGRVRDGDTTGIDQLLARSSGLPLSLAQLGAELA